MDQSFRSAQEDTIRTFLSLLAFRFKRRCLFRQPNACQKEPLQQRLSAFESGGWGGDAGLVEKTNLLPQHISLGGGGDFSQGFGQSSLQSPVLA